MADNAGNGQKKDEFVDWDDQQQRPPGEPGSASQDPNDKNKKRLIVYLVLIILILLVFVVFIAWVWISELYGWTLPGRERPVATTSQSISSEPGSASSDGQGQGGGWWGTGSRGGQSGHTPYVSLGYEELPSSSGEDEYNGGGGGTYYPSRPSTSSEDEYQIVLVDGTTSRPDGMASLPSIPTASTDQDAVNPSPSSMVEAPTNRPFAAMLEPADELSKSFLFDVQYRASPKAAVFLEFVAEVSDPNDTAFDLTASQKAEISSRTQEQARVSSTYVSDPVSHPTVTSSDPTFASKINVALDVYDLNDPVTSGSDVLPNDIIDEIEVPDTSPGASSGATVTRQLTLQDVIDSSKLPAANQPQEGIKICDLPVAAGTGANDLLRRSYQVRLRFEVDPLADNRYQGAQLGGDLAWTLCTETAARAAAATSPTVFAANPPQTGTGTDSPTAMASPRALIYIPALDLNITLEMLINFVVATLLSFGFLWLIAKSKQLNEEMKQEQYHPPNARQPAPSRPAAPPGRAANIERAAINTAAYRTAQLPSRKRVSHQIKSSLVFILILISLIVGFTVAAFTWKVQANVIDNSITGSTIRPIIYAGSTYQAGTGDDNIPIFENADASAGELLIREFHILNIGASRFQYRVYAKDVIDADANQPLSVGEQKLVKVSIYYTEADAKENKNLLFSATLDKFNRDGDTFHQRIQRDESGNIVYASGTSDVVSERLTVNAHDFTRTEQHKDDRYFMRIDIDPALGGKTIGFTVQAEAMQDSDKLSYNSDGSLNSNAWNDAWSGQPDAPSEWRSSAASGASSASSSSSAVSS